MLALRKQAIPPPAHLSGRLDPACDGVDHVMERRCKVSLQAAPPNSFAFGAATPCWRFAQILEFPIEDIP